jgi:hypothetical protein
MTEDLPVQIRELCDSAEPVTAAEAMLRARTHSIRRRTWPLRGALVAVAAVAAASAILASSLHSGSARSHRASSSQAIVLTGARLDAIVLRSSSASSTGTAQVTQATSQNGMPQSSQSVAVTFDGPNIDERITVEPEPPGSAKPFTADDRLVDGQFYIDTPGPSGVTEWLHDTNSVNDVTSMQFPDPRTLYGTLGSAGRFVVVGATTANGTTLTHLKALDPGALDTAQLGSLADGSLTSFDIWIDPDDVVQRMAFSSAVTAHVCHVDFTSSKLKQLAERTRLGHLSSPALQAAAKREFESCGPQTTMSSVTVNFANLGEPESVTAPPGAVDFAGKG